MQTSTAYTLAGLLMMTVACSNGSKTETTKAKETEQPAKVETAMHIDHIPFKTITGDSTDLAAYTGKVVLIVNVASECGNTPQYEGLETLYETYKDSGLVILGFPANNFGEQEPGTNEEILTFCQTKFNVKFPMMSKVSVLGEDKHPLFVQLTEKSSIPGDIKWNFAKFLLDRKGQLVARFDPKVEPMSEEVVAKIKSLL